MYPNKSVHISHNTTIEYKNQNGKLRKNKLQKPETPTERALGLATCLNTHITSKEEWFQELVQVVEAHRKKYSNKTNKNLKACYSNINGKKALTLVKVSSL